MKILIVGAGLYGAVLGRALAEAGHQVHFIEKRDHIAGNCFDFVNAHGIRVHRYGPHIFHTSNEKVISYVKRFAEWTPYRHRVRAQLENGIHVPLPVNRETLIHVPADRVIDVFYRPYTKKMWGLSIEELDPSILSRVPITPDAPDDYFPHDTFVGFPLGGYTQFVGEILRHKSISVALSAPYSYGQEEAFDFCFNAMPIDEYFDFQLGRLPYRSIRFHHFDVPAPRMSPFSVINFTHDGPMTRVTEWKNFPDHGEAQNVTSLTFEEPCADHENNYERYYPVKDRAGLNRTLYKSYQALTPSRMKFIGRTGLYAYLDMHQAISSALAVAEEFLTQN